MATHLLGHQQGTLAYIENKAEKAMFKHEIDVQTVLQSTLLESVVAYLLHVNEVIPSWKSFNKYAPFLEANVAPVSHKKVSATATATATAKATAKASAAKEPSLASSAYKPIGSATATASSGYKPIGSTRKASRSPSPLRKSAATKKANSRYPSTTSTSGYAAAAKKVNAKKPNVKVAEGKSKSKNFSLFENMLGND
jgi:hypothetical protein